MCISLGKAIYQSGEWLDFFFSLNSYFEVRFTGERICMYSCCSAPLSESEGCAAGPHVFVENSSNELHTRHPFSLSRMPSKDENSVETALDVVALDCEMIYTTGGIGVARVSVVDGGGKEILDEYVQLDDGVEVMYI